MKKLLVILSAFILTTISTNQLVQSMISTNIIKPIMKNQNKELEQLNKLNNDENPIDWNKVEDYFKDEKNKTNNQSNMSNSISFLKNENKIDIAFQKASEYVKEFKEKNTFLPAIITKFQNEIPKFNTVYQREKQKIIITNPFNLKSIHENKLPELNLEEEKKLKLEAIQFWDKLNKIKILLATAIAISAIAAAGLWESAWLGGISIPWAVAATTATAVMGTMLAALNIYLHTTNPYMDKILQLIAITVNCGLLIYEAATVVKVFTKGIITLTSTSVVMPAFTAVTSVITALYYWVNKTDIFKQMDNNNIFKSNIDEISNSKNLLVNIKIDNELPNGIIGNTSSSPKTRKEDYELLDWTKYATTIDEFENNIKGIILIDSKAFVGDNEDNNSTTNIIISKSSLGEYNKNRKVKLVEHSYNPWYKPCHEKDSISYLSWYYEEKILIRWFLAVESNCRLINYASISYKSVSVIL